LAGRSEATWRLPFAAAEEPHIWLSEPKLAFHPERASDHDIHPLRGLLRFGPYSSGLVPDPIRVATISPAGESDHLFSFVRELNAASKPTERREYLPEWPGFQRVFGLHMRGATRGCHLESTSYFVLREIETMIKHPEQLLS
jgi:hypothetical protein